MTDQWYKYRKKKIAEIIHLVKNFFQITIKLILINYDHDSACVTFFSFSAVEK